MFGLVLTATIVVSPSQEQLHVVSSISEDDAKSEVIEDIVVMVESANCVVLDTSSTVKVLCCCCSSVEWLVSNVVKVSIVSGSVDISDSVMSVVSVILV